MPRKKPVADDDVRQYMRVVKKDVDERLTDLKAEMDDIQKKAAKALKEQPMLILGIAFLAGVAVGIALANSGD